MLRNVSFHTMALMLAAGVATAADPVQTPQVPRANQGNTQPQVRPAAPRESGVQQQQGVRPGERREHVEANRQAHASLDVHIASCLTLANQEEINLAKFALERAQDPRVKEFAEKMIRDHEALNQKLQPYAGQRLVTSTGTPTFKAEGERQPAATSADRREARQELREQGIAPREAREIVREGAQQGGALTPGQRPMEQRTGFRGDDASVSDRMFQIAKEAHKNCEQMVREELSKETGADFDKAFVATQIGAHIGMLAHLKAVQPHVSGHLQQIVTEATQTAEQHKQQVDKLMKDLKMAPAVAAPATR
ncbi:DUF4142 domain-containing protein [Planctomicrobium sp. SH527]|uniref:DUF4142 domain-containing protein n=1 Tax=Planctomicrobium sp. SH527 TaxID=3448123 RepID=UPI003F5C33C4